MRTKLFEIKREVPPAERLRLLVAYYRKTGIENWEDIEDLELKSFVLSNSSPERLWSLVKSEKFL
jgi:hypothetical protein